MFLRHCFKILLYLILGLSVSCGGGGSDSSKLSSNACAVLNLPVKSARIINGESCGLLASSPVVRIVMYNISGQAIGLCSGTMISSNDVLTAAHCDLAGTVFAEVIYGDAETSRAVPVKSIARHPGYQGISPGSDKNAAFNDVAVYSLSSDLDIPVLPIAKSRTVQSGDVINIYGYGQDENGNLDFRELQSGQMLVENVTANHISAFFNGDGSNTCQGDSGGPAVFEINGKPAIAGITSSGSRDDCLKGDNSLFTNLQDASVLQFIVAIVPDAGTI